MPDRRAYVIQVSLDFFTVQKWRKVITNKITPNTNILFTWKRQIGHCVHEINCYTIRMLAHVGILFHFVDDSDF